MADDTPRDLPWGRLAVLITGVFLLLLVERSLRHVPVRRRGLIEIVRPEGRVESFSPVVWEGPPVGELFRYMVFVRSNDAADEELVRSPPLTTYRWEIPEGALEGQDHVQIRVYLLDPEADEEVMRKDAPAVSRKVIATRL